MLLVLLLTLNLLNVHFEQNLITCSVAITSTYTWILDLEHIRVVESEEDPHPGVVESVEVRHGASALGDAAADDEGRGRSGRAARGRDGGVDVSGREYEIYGIHSNIIHLDTQHCGELDLGDHIHATYWATT